MVTEKKKSTPKISVLGYRLIFVLIVTNTIIIRNNQKRIERLEVQQQYLHVSRDEAMSAYKIRHKSILPFQSPTDEKRYWNNKEAQGSDRALLTGVSSD